MLSWPVVDTVDRSLHATEGVYEHGWLRGIWKYPDRSGRRVPECNE